MWVKHLPVLTVLGALMVLTLASTGAWGHRLAQTMTDIEWSPDRGTLEIIHSIHLDDAMLLLAALDAPKGEWNLELEARILLYVEEHFTISAGGVALPVQPVGAQIRGDYLWVYQELPLSTWPEDLAVDVAMMQEFEPAQKNFVNLKIGDHVRSRVADL